MTTFRIYTTVFFDNHVDHSYDANWLAAVHVLKYCKTRSHPPSHGAPYTYKYQVSSCSAPIAPGVCLTVLVDRSEGRYGQPSGRATSWMHLQPALPLCVADFAGLLGCLCVVPIAAEFLRS